MSPNTRRSRRRWRRRGKWHDARRGGGLINAVLRRAAREGDAFDSAPATSVWPDWLAARMKAALGAEQRRRDGACPARRAADRSHAALGADDAERGLNSSAREIAAERLAAAAAARGADREPAGLCRGRMVGAGHGGGASGPAAGRRARAGCGGPLRGARRQGDAARRAWAPGCPQSTFRLSASRACARTPSARGWRWTSSRLMPAHGVPTSRSTPCCSMRRVRRLASSAAIPKASGGAIRSDLVAFPV